MKRLYENNLRIRALTLEEEAGLFAAISKSYERLRPIITIALNTGMRQAEIVNLEWQHIDWERNRIVVFNTKSDRDRFIPMNQIARQLLVRLSRERNGNRLFPELNPCLVACTFRHLAKKAGLSDFHIHALRHTFATRLVASGVDLITTAALLGHSTLEMVKRYAHPSDPFKAKAVEKIANFAANCQKNVNGEVLEFKSQIVK